MTLPASDQLRGAKLKMIPPTVGHHRFGGSKQKSYEAVHAFVADREWCAAPAGEKLGGVTWVELLALFDTQGYCSIEQRLQIRQQCLRQGRD